MDIEELKRIRRYAIIALFSDDYLMDRLVLKGGNALDIVYGLTSRPSIDIDVSIEDDFPSNQIEEIERKIRKSLSDTFSKHGYVIMDFKFSRKPEKPRNDQPKGWGGYEILFKLVTRDVHKEHCGDIGTLRMSALPLGEGAKTPLKIDISKYEFCGQKTGKEVDNFTIFVYTPEMIVIEKLRSICQQMEEYISQVGKGYRTPRAKDFYDIYAVCRKFPIDICSELNREIFRGMFAAKHVPLHLLGRIREYKDYHETDYVSLEQTVSHKELLKPFEDYFEFVIGLSDSLKPLWEEQPPSV